MPARLKAFKTSLLTVMMFMTFIYMIWVILGSFDNDATRTRSVESSYKDTMKLMAQKIRNRSPFTSNITTTKSSPSLVKLSSFISNLNLNDPNLRTSQISNQKKDSMKNVVKKNSPRPSNSSSQHNQIHKMKSQKSSIVSNGNIYGSHLKEDSDELILGLAADTDAKSLAIFCGSIRRVSPHIDVVLFINSPIPIKHIEIAKRYDIVLHEYLLSSLEPLFLRHYHPSTLRWILFHRLLHFEHEGTYLTKYKKVLFADVRDTVLQTNVFDLIHLNVSIKASPSLSSSSSSSSSSFYVFQENAGINIGSCSWNSGWVKDCFHSSILTSIESLPIICSGISLGTMAGASEYTTIMSTILLGKPLKVKGGKNKNIVIDTSRFPYCERNGVDQGVHNVVVHLGLIKNLEIKDELNFPVTHLQSSSLSQDINMIMSTRIVSSTVIHSNTNNNNNNNIPYIALDTNNIHSIFAVVHQYDRWHNYQVALAVQYVYWTDCANEQKVWQDDSPCSKYTYVAGEDIFAGNCDMGSFRALTSSSCCIACDMKNKQTNAASANNHINNVNNNKLCNAFAYSEGICFLKSCELPLLQNILKKKKAVIETSSVIPLKAPLMMSAFRLV